MVTEDKAWIRKTGAGKATNRDSVEFLGFLTSYSSEILPVEPNLQFNATEACKSEDDNSLRLEVMAKT